MRRVSVLCSALAAIAAAVSPAVAGPAIGQFELKDLEAGPDHLQFQSQNAYSWGQPRRGVLPDGAGGYLYDDNSVTRQRHALEVEKGFTSYLKGRLGIEFEKERTDDPGTPSGADAFEELKLSEVGGEVIAVLVPRDGDGTGLGFVVEGEMPVDSAEQLGLNFGPIFEFAKGQWSATVIPTLVYSFGGDVEAGERRDDKLDFAYAAEVVYVISDAWKLSLEAYGTIDRVLGTGDPSDDAVAFGDHDQHRAGPVLYYAFETASGGPSVSIGTGFLVGLNKNTPDGTFKLSVELEY